MEDDIKTPVFVQDNKAIGDGRHRLARKIVVFFSVSPSSNPVRTVSRLCLNYSIRSVFLLEL